MSGQEHLEEERSKQGASSTSSALETAFSSAVQHHQAGRLREAEQLYQQILALHPRHAETLHLLGVIAHQVGRHEIAVDLISRAIVVEPMAALYHSNLGNAFKELGGLEQAVACYRQAINLKPHYPEAYNNLGTALQEQKKFSEAIACFRKAVDLKSDFSEAHNNLGNGLAEQGQFHEAVTAYQKAVALKSDFPEAHNNLGTVLKNLGALDEAVASYQKAIALRPDFPEAHNNLGIVLKKQERLDEAIAYSRKAIELKADSPEAHYNLGVALADQGKIDEAVTCFRIAIKLKPHFPDAHHNLALALLARGDLTEGWQEYEWRWKTTRLMASRRSFAQPQWRGETAEGRTLLIHAEQGFGDTLQFCRYASLAAARGLRVILEVQKPLVRLLRDLAGVDQILAHGDELPVFDFHCPMLSMPLACGTTMATIPSAVSYLVADAEKVMAWHARLPPQGRKIGLAWAGNRATDADERRSLTLRQLTPLLNVPHLHFFSLQKDEQNASSDVRITSFMNEMVDFADTAAFIAHLDLVISVDTAVAHVAAALGKPVWLLDRFDPDWRWLLGRRDSPWYPTLRLYRQPQLGDWGSVLAEVVEDLQPFARG